MVILTASPTGEIKLPKWIWKTLKSKSFILDVRNGHIILIPISQEKTEECSILESLEGSLQEYAKRNMPYEEIVKLEDQAVEEGFTEDEDIRR